MCWEHNDAHDHMCVHFPGYPPPDPVIAYDFAKQKNCNAEILALLKPPQEMQPDRGEKLFYAAANGDLDEVARLLNAGVFVDAREGHCGRTPLMHAAGHGSLPLMRLLMEAKADVGALYHGALAS